MKQWFDTKIMYVIMAIMVFGAFTFGMVAERVWIHKCPAAPVAVDTVYVGDHVDWLYYEKALEITAENELYADSIATLNAALGGHTKNCSYDGVLGHTMPPIGDVTMSPAPCAGMVSIEAVEGLFTYHIDSEPTYYISSDSQALTVETGPPYTADTTVVFDWDKWKQRIKEAR